MPKLPNPYQPITKGFQSGCSICKASTDYKNIEGELMPKQASSSANLVNNGYNCSKKATDVFDPAGFNFNDNDYGIAYNTSGGAKKKKSGIKKKKSGIKKKKSVVKKKKSVVKKKKVVKRKRSIVNNASRTIRKVSKPVMNKIKSLGKLLGVNKVVRKTTNITKKVAKKSISMPKKVIKKTTNVAKKVVKRSLNMPKKVVKKAVKKTKKVVKQGTSLPRKVVKKVKPKTKKQRGGDTNWGATGMPARYYKPYHKSNQPTNLSNPNVKGGLATSKGLKVYSPYKKDIFAPTKYDGNPQPYDPWMLEGGKKLNKRKQKAGSKNKKKLSPKKKTSQIW